MLRLIRISGQTCTGMASTLRLASILTGEERWGRRPPTTVSLVVKTVAYLGLECSDTVWLHGAEPM